MRQTVLRSCVAALVGAVLGSAGLGAESGVQLVVRADRPGAKISSTMYGVFFEDINFGADGGLYAELVKNGSFEFSDPMMGWSEDASGAGAGSLQVLGEAPLNPANPHYVRINASQPGSAYGIVNEGFAGIGVRQGEDYIFSAFARGSWLAGLRIELVTSDMKQVLAKGEIGGNARGWTTKSVVLRPKATEAHARLRVLLQTRDRAATVELDMISLFPRGTWKKRPNGLRADLVQWLADLKPGFVRFPGGCIVEGRYLSTRYQWKNTVGKPEERKLLINRWNDEFKHRPAPDYFQSFGLGFYEYFLLCEDIRAEPLPILNCGMACQFNSNELVPLDQLDPYIQDALDLIEFANGPATSTWGAKRAQMGHPKPFHLKLLGVGNEQWGPQYIERYERFAKALKAKYPDIKLVSSAGPSPDDDRFAFLWPKLRELKADIVDEHCYANPDWFFDNARRYDNYDRNGPKVFMGEYAAQSVKTVSPDNRNNWQCALSEAAYMTGLERNADVVVMSSYAPLFAHEERWQWRPDLIWCDNLQSYGTPNYYVQQMFSLNRGDVVLPVEVRSVPVRASEETPDGVTTNPSSKQPGLYVTASRDQKAGEIILKVVSNASAPIAADVKLEGIQQTARRGTMILLAGAKLTDENSLAEPRKVVPVTSALRGVSTSFQHTFAPYSLTVLRLNARE
jgi:alpha-N-arabinofuranosidase